MMTNTLIGCKNCSALNRSPMVQVSNVALMQTIL
jgi:hypothetical protein